MGGLIQGNAGLFLALGAGVASFVSPCILPIIPSFLSYLGGITATTDAGSPAARRFFLRQILLFVIGFSLVFVTLGTLFSSAGLLLGGARAAVFRVAGVVVVVFGLNTIFDFWSVLNRERRFRLRGRPLGGLGSLAVGLAFGAGWTPCVGPVLASILFLAGTSGTIAHGILLLSAYSLGLGLPFLAAGAFSGWFLRQARRLRPYVHRIKIASGSLLVAMGVLIFAGSLARLNSVFFGLASQLSDWRLREPQAPGTVFGLVFGLLSAASVVLYARRILLQQSETPGLARRVFRPVLLAMIVLLSALSVLSFSNILQVDALAESWLRFQGI
jgi:cytochrome c-type biogenesis protein